MSLNTLPDPLLQLIAGHLPLPARGHLALASKKCARSARAAPFDMSDSSFVPSQWSGCRRLGVKAIELQLGEWPSGLTSLTIFSCQALPSVEIGSALRNLRHVEISTCRMLKRVSISAPNLGFLRVTCNPSLTRCHATACPAELEVKECDLIQAIGSIGKLRRLSVDLKSENLRIAFDPGLTVLECFSCPSSTQLLGSLDQLESLTVEGTTPAIFDRVPLPKLHTLVVRYAESFPLSDHLKASLLNLALLGNANLTELNVPKTIQQLKVENSTTLQRVQGRECQLQTVSFRECAQLVEVELHSAQLRQAEATKCPLLSLVKLPCHIEEEEGLPPSVRSVLRRWRASKR